MSCLPTPSEETAADGEVVGVLAAAVEDEASAAGISTSKFIKSLKNNDSSKSVA